MEETAAPRRRRRWCNRIRESTARRRRRGSRQSCCDRTRGGRNHGCSRDRSAEACSPRTGYQAHPCCESRHASQHRDNRFAGRCIDRPAWRCDLDAQSAEACRSAGIASRGRHCCIRPRPDLVGTGDTARTCAQPRGHGAPSGCKRFIIHARARRQRPRRSEGQQARPQTAGDAVDRDDACPARRRPARAAVTTAKATRPTSDPANRGYTRSPSPT